MSAEQQQGSDATTLSNDQQEESTGVVVPEESGGQKGDAAPTPLAEAPTAGAGGAATTPDASSTAAPVVAPATNSSSSAPAVGSEFLTQLYEKRTFIKSRIAQEIADSAETGGSAMLVPKYEEALAVVLKQIFAEEMAITAPAADAGAERLPKLHQKRAFIRSRIAEEKANIDGGETLSFSSCNLLLPLYENAREETALKIFDEEMSIAAIPMPSMAAAAPPPPPSPPVVAPTTAANAKAPPSAAPKKDSSVSSSARTMPTGVVASAEQQKRQQRFGDMPAASSHITLTAGGNAKRVVERSRSREQQQRRKRSRSPQDQLSRGVGLPSAGRHPCLKAYGHCWHGAKCALAEFPSEACVNHLKGKCKNGKSCVLKHYSPNDPAYVQLGGSVAKKRPTSPPPAVHSDRPDLVAQKQRTSGGSSSSTRLHPCDRAYGQCNITNGRCRFALFPYDTCLLSMKGKRCDRPGCNMIHNIHQDDPRYQNPDWKGRLTKRKNKYDDNDDDDDSASFYSDDDDDRDRRDVRSYGGIPRPASSNARTSAKPRTHPCLRVFGTCKFGDDCDWLYFPYDACIRHLMDGFCKNRSTCKKEHIGANAIKYRRD